jgi:hypothetical protein
MNIVDFEALQAQEEKVLAELSANTEYNNPYDDFADALRTGDCRRFITGYGEVDFSQLRERQVAEKILCKIRATEELAPLIERDGLRNLPIVEETIHPHIWDIVSGQHRAYAIDTLKRKVPVLFTTKNYNISGGTVPPDIDIIQAVRANPPMENRTFSTADAVYTLSKGLAANPTQDGHNPSGGIPPRESDGYDFDDLVNRYYGPNYFPFKGTRTKIRNAMLRSTNRSKLIDMNFDAQTDHLRDLGWSTGIKGSGRTRLQSHEHFDSNRDCMIVMTDSNGRHVDEKFFGILKRYHTDAAFRKTLSDNNIKYIDVAARIYRPSSDKATLDSSRATVLAKLQDMNLVLSASGVSLSIREVSFAKQLDTSGDAHTSHFLNV